jgi:hypothetical protein
MIHSPHAQVFLGLPFSLYPCNGLGNEIENSKPEPMNGTLWVFKIFKGSSDINLKKDKFPAVNVESTLIAYIYASIFATKTNHIWSIISQWQC